MKYLFPPSFTPYASEYQTVYDSYDTRPTRLAAEVDNAMVQGWVDDGVWPKLDAIWILANHAEGLDSLRNWKQPAGGPSLMDPGKGVFTEITDPLVDVGKGVFTEITDDLITNGGFDTDTWWSKSVPEVTISGGTANFDNTGGSIYKSGVLTVGKIYRVIYTVDEYTAGTVATLCGTTAGTNRTSEDTYSEVLLCAGNTVFYVDGIGSFTGKIDDVSVIEQNIESWVKNGTNIIENDGGTLKTTFVDNANGAHVYLRETKDLNTDLVVGKWYRIRVRAKVNAGASVILRIGSVGYNFATITSESYAWYEGVFEANHATACNLTFNGMGGSEIIWVDEWTLVEQNVESWDVYGTNTIENDAGALKITWVDTIWGAYHEFKAVNDINTDLTIGKTYKVRVRAKKNSGDPMVNVGGYGVNVDSGSLTTDFEWYEIIFVAAHATGMAIRCRYMSAGEIVWIDEWDVQEWTNATVVGSPVHTIWEGYQGDGSAVINLNWNPTVNGVNYTLNSATLGLYSRTDINEDTIDMGVRESTDYSYVVTRWGDNLYNRMNSAGFRNQTSLDSRGMFINTRNDATDVQSYYNKTLRIDASAASTSIPNGSIYLMAYNLVGSGPLLHTNRQYSLAVAGGGFTQTDVDSLVDRFETRMDYYNKGVI